jgi:hypothetical protein
VHDLNNNMCIHIIHTSQVSHIIEYRAPSAQWSMKQHIDMGWAWTILLKPRPSIGAVPITPCRTGFSLSIQFFVTSCVSNP